MATKQSIAIREYAAREAIQRAIRDISDALGVTVAPQPLEPVRDPAYRAMRELEQLADLLGQIRDVLQPPEEEADKTSRQSDMGTGGTEESGPAESAGDAAASESANGEDDSDDSVAASLEALTVQQLRDLAEARGVTVDAKARKAEIVDALLAAYEDSQA